MSVEEFASLESNISQWTKQMDDKDKLLSEKESKDIVISAAKSEKEKESGNDYLRSKDYEMALECYSRSIGLNPKNAASYFNRALVYLKQKQFNKAVDDCTSALENKKDYFKANHRRAKALIELKDFNAAISDLEIVLEKNPENNEATSELKMCREEIGKISGYRRINIIEADEEEEEEEEKEKEKNMPKVYEVFDEKPKIETKICEEEKALKVIKDIGDFEDFMKNVEEKKRNGNDFFKNEDFDSAIEEFSEAIDRIENSFREQEILLESRLLIITIALLNNRALAFSKLDCNNEAIQDSLKVLKLDLANVKALFRIAKCEANRSNFKEAKKRMGQVLQIDPSHSVAKADFEEYSKKFIEIDEVKNEPLTPRRASNVSENSEAFLDTSYKTLERRVSFKAEDIEELGLEKKNPSAKEYFKKLDAKYPKREEQEEDIEEVKSNRIEKDPEEFQLEFLKEKKMKKSTPVAISQETINNAKEIASKLTSSFEVPKTVLMFESAAKALKNDKMQFYNYIKVKFT